MSVYNIDSIYVSHNTTTSVGQESKVRLVRLVRINIRTQRENNEGGNIVCSLDRFQWWVKHFLYIKQVRK